MTKISNSIKIEFGADEIAYLADSLADPFQHSENIAREKVMNCQQRMFGEWIPRLRGRGQTIPNDDEELLALILAQPDYRNRDARDERGTLTFPPAV